MLNTEHFGTLLNGLGFDFYSGIPCTFLKSLINYATCNANYVAAANEGDAVATCFGATLGGAKSVVLMQNSGLANAISPLTSLNFPFRLPVLGFVSLRGEPGFKDEPQHELMGAITTRLLDDMQIPWAFLSKDPAEARAQLDVANESIERGQTYFFVVRKDTFENYELTEQAFTPRHNELQTKPNRTSELPRREAVLRTVTALGRPNTVFLATTGVTGRELYQVADGPDKLYMVGSMGCIGPMALGLALRRPDLEVVAIDGDGALLMRMGSLAITAAYRPTNMLHLLLDNNAHESTGAQATSSHHVQFAEIAASCGFARSLFVHSQAELGRTIAEWRESPDLTFMHMKIAVGHLDPLVRPTETPAFIARRLMTHLGVAELPTPPNEPIAVTTRHVLYTPGPATTDDRVKTAQVMTDISPRTPEFEAVLQEVTQGITAIAGSPATHDTVLMGGSGTAGVEAMLSSVGATGRRILIIDNGAYGQRMGEIAERHGLNYATFKSDPCQPVDLEHLGAFMRASAEPFAWLAVVHHETTTGLHNDLATLGALAQAQGARLLVDAMSSFGALPIDMAAMNIGFVVSSSNKNLQGMPGVAFVVCDKAELAALAGTHPRGYYLDLHSEHAYFQAHRQTRFTAPVQTLYALREAMRQFQQEGQARRYARYSSNSLALQQGLEQLGFRSLVARSAQAGLLLSLVPPEGERFEFAALNAYFAQRGITIYQGKLENVRYLRLATIGTITSDDVGQFLQLMRAYCERAPEAVAAGR